MALGIVDGECMDAPWECIVIGGGAAGLSAALVLGRARRRTLLLDAGGQSNLAAHGIGGLLGQDGRPAPEFYADGRRELEQYPSIEVRDLAAAAVRRDHDGFAVSLDDGAIAVAERLVLATGAEYRLPDVEGIAERFGVSAFHCPFCHGWEVRDGALAVLDPGPHAVARALTLRAWSDDVTLLTDGSTLDAPAVAQLAAAGVTVDERAVAAFEGPGDALEAVRFAHGDTRPCTGVLVGVTLEQRGSLAVSLGAALSTDGFPGWETLQVDPTGQTTVPGVWAVGDAATSAPSVAGAIESGARAAAGIVHGITAALGQPAAIAST